MKLFGIYTIVIVLLLSCYRYPNIYNDGTAWKMPRNLETSDFYKDIENYYQYEGIVQEYRAKIKSFLWINENNPNYKLESAFYLVKEFPGSDPNRYKYRLEIRRYITVENEEPNKDIISEMRAYRTGYRFTKGFSKLLLGGEPDFIQNFGSAHVTLWGTKNGSYERFTQDLWFEKEQIIGYILGKATKFEMHFDNGEDDEHFLELDNNILILTDEELENLRDELREIIKIKKKKPKEYFQFLQGEDLR
jgi:hypothetical protein